MKEILTDRNRLGMLLFIASEAVFFALLISAYVYYQSVTFPGPNASNSLDPGLTAIYTVFLLASSVTAWAAGKSLEHGSRRGLIGWLILTIVLGGIFLFGQGREYLHLLSQNISIDRNLFGTTFFTLTGFHGLHVLVGLIAIAILALLGWRGAFKGPKSGAVEAISMYWHFVDVVWIVLFSLIYLWPLFV
jgi:heme/copper-type cytochrome/quinol oxidase subunit 3